MEIDKYMDSIVESVKAKYGEVARRVATGSGERASCCGPACCGGESDPITSNLYTADETGTLPETAVLASLGCGNPTALAELRPGEVVLDLGSGGGIDRVQPAFHGATGGGGVRVGGPETGGSILGAGRIAIADFHQRERRCAAKRGKR